MSDVWDSEMFWISDIFYHLQFQSILYNKKYKKHIKHS